MAKSANDMVWTNKYVESLSPDDASIPAAQKVLKKGGFGKVDATADGRGWWVVCQGLTGEYQVTVRRLDEKEREYGEEFQYRCTCPSPKIPCKHALALLLYLVEHPEMRPEAEEAKVAASDFEGLLRGAFRESEEDTPRLVFADLLEENNQPDRAALIRYQCEYARLKPQSKRGKELKKIITPLLAKLKKEVGPLPEGLRYEFRRGFMRLHGHPNHFANANLFPVRLMNLFRDGWIETIVTTLYWNLQDEMLPILAQVGELDVTGYQLPDESLIRLVTDTAEARTNGRLAHVTVPSKNRKEFNRLLRAERGEEIDLTRGLEPTRHFHNQNASTFQQLVRFGRLSGARDLSLRGCQIGTPELTEFLAHADLTDLRHLRVYMTPFTKPMIEALTSSPKLTKLATLELEWCSVRWAALTALVNSPLFSTLQTLDLSSNNIGKAGVAALLKVDVPSKLKKLVLSNCLLEPAQERQLKKKYGTKLRV